jgi:hypothetical protein
MTWLVLAAVQSTAATVEKYRLDVKFEQGRVRVVQFASRSVLNIRFVQGESVEDKENLVHHTDLEWTDTIIEAKDGVPKKVERAYTKAQFERQEPEDPEKRSGKLTLEGQKINLKDEGRKRTRVEAPASVKPEDLREVRLREGCLLSGRPREPVGPGHSWTPKPQDVLAEFNDQESGVTYEKADVRCVFEKVEDRGGDACAVIKASGTLQGSNKDGVSIALKFETTLALSLSKTQVLESDTTGTFELKGGGEGQHYTLMGSGSMRSTLRVQVK